MAERLRLVLPGQALRLWTLLGGEDHQLWPRCGRTPLGSGCRSGLVGVTLARFDPASLLMGVILTSLCYLRRDGCTLMVHKARGQQRGKWNGLGGKFEPGERPEVCARREVIEESGLTVGRLEYRGLLTFPRFDGVHDSYSFVFTSTDFRGELRASGEGELAWVPDDELLDLELYEGDRVFLPWLDPKSPTSQGRIFSACLRYREGIFTGYEVSFYPPD